MRFESEEEILTRAIDHFAISNEFLHMCNINKFNCLQDILKHDVNTLMSKEKFSARMLKELFTILQAYRLERYMDE